MKKKNLISIIVSILLVASLFAGCSATTTSSSSSSKKIKVGYVVADLGNSYFVAVSNAVKDEAKAQGIDVTVIDGKNDSSTQINAIENLITQKVDVIVCAPVDPTSIEPLIKKAHDAGIKFIASAQEIKGYDVFVTVPDYDYGYAGGTMAGKWMKANLSGKVEVALIDHPEIKQLIDRTNGIEKGIKEQYPDAVVVAHQDAVSAEAGMKAAETILQAHPNVKVIYAINDDIALGAVEAVKSMGKAGNNFGIFGLDATDHALSALKEKGIFRGTINSEPTDIGKKIVEYSIKLAKNETISNKIVSSTMVPVTQ